MAAALVPDPAAAPPTPSPAPNSRAWILSLRGGPAAQLRFLESHWRPLWQRPAAGAVPEEWMAELDGLPPFPERTPWTAELVRSILKRLQPRKAAGLERRMSGMSPRQMARLGLCHGGAVAGSHAGS